MPCSDWDGKDMPYLRTIFNFIDANPSMFDNTKIYAQGFSQNSMGVLVLAQRILNPQKEMMIHDAVVSIYPLDDPNPMILRNNHNHIYIYILYIHYIYIYIYIYIYVLVYIYIYYMYMLHIYTHVYLVRGGVRQGLP